MTDDIDRCYVFGIGGWASDHLHLHRCGYSRYHVVEGTGRHYYGGSLCTRCGKEPEPELARRKL